MYVIIALIFISIVLVARIAIKWRLPLVVIAMGAGILFGSDILGLLYFDNAVLAKQIADVALMFVLFVGGFGTKKDNLRLVLRPAMMLATLGVISTAAVVSLFFYLVLNYNLSRAILLGCVISSTDAAAVFSILRSRSLNRKLSSLVEIESATNDPMAIILASIAVQLSIAQVQSPVHIGLSLIWQLLGGIGIGLLAGKFGCILFQFVKVLDRGYFYIFLISVILLSYGAADISHASGVLSAFFAGYVMGNSTIPYKKTLATFLDALSTIANVIIFVILGLLVFPREFGFVFQEGIFLFIVLTFLARPVSVFLCTLFSNFSFKEKIFISWSGLRGAVPIVLATYPVAAGIENSRSIFNVVFFTVALSIVVQGATIRKIADIFKLGINAKVKPRQVMELVTLHTSDLELLEFQIDEEIFGGSVQISNLRLPQGTTITMINRHERIIAPQGSTKIFPGDVLYILVKNTNIDLVTSRILDRFTPKEEKRS